jgi:hypothetical protein
VAANLARRPARVPVTAGEILLATAAGVTPADGAVDLPAESAAVLAL